MTVGQPVATISRTGDCNCEPMFQKTISMNLKIRANFMVSYNNKVYRLEDLHGRLLSFGKAAAESSFYIPITFEFDNIGDFIPGSYVEVYLLTTPKITYFPFLLLH